jgi:hypothetical protein
VSDHDGIPPGANPAPTHAREALIAACGVTVSCGVTVRAPALTLNTDNFNEADPQARLADVLRWIDNQKINGIDQLLP